MSTSSTWVKGPTIDELSENSVYLLEHGADGIVIVNHKGEFTAFRNSCLHQELPLHSGYLDHDGVLLCPWHNWCYDMRDGKCLTAPGAYLDRHATRVEDGHVWVAG